MPATAMPVSSVDKPETFESREWSLSDFLDWDQEEAETGDKFEWVEGSLELAGTWMKPEERHIVLNLDERFSECSAHKSKSRLLPETKCVLNDSKVRIPDISFFELDQIKQSQNNEHPIPRWVIEIISPSDKAFAIEKKVKEYFDSGVELVWQIFPELERVRIYTGTDQVAQFSGDSICSAKPVVNDFEIKVSEIFKEW